MLHSVFVDAGAWVGITDRGDRHHEAANNEYGRLLREGAALVTTNLVVAEAYIVVRRNAGHQIALRFLRSIRESRRVHRLYSDAELEEQAEEILRRYADQDFSLVDAVSFAAMRQRKITHAFAFDRHFATAGFTLVPAPA